MAAPAFVRVPPPEPKPDIALPLVRVDPAKIEIVHARMRRKACLLAARGQAREERRLKRLRAVDVILLEVEYRYGVSIADLRSRKMAAHFTRPRSIAMALLFRVGRLSLKQVVAVLNRTHHTTALGGLRTVETRIAEDPAFAAEIAGLEADLRRMLERA